MDSTWNHHLGPYDAQRLAILEANKIQGGCHVLMGDGAVKFVTDSIDAGNSTATAIWNGNDPGAPSPYGLWGVLGTRAVSDQVADFLRIDC